jgi:N-acetyl-anhydromuramyl-L-alanine amidase AmpD
VEIKRLPSFCFPGRNIKIEGMTVHHSSGINIEPSNPFDPEVIWKMLHDLNLPKSGRKFYPNCEGVPRTYASYNQLIGRNRGESMLLVPFGKEVYHAGVSLHKGRADCNKFMAAVALAGTEESGFTDWQYEELAETAAEQRHLYGFPNEDIVGHDRLRYNAKKAGMRHSDGRIPADKFDPSGKADGTGTNFDWPRFYAMVDKLLAERKASARIAAALK